MDRAKIRELMEASFRENGAFSAEEEIEVSALGLIGDDTWLRVEEGGFQVFRARPLRSGHSLLYSSAEDRVRVQD